MVTIYVSFVACLAAQPNVCHDQRMTFAADHHPTPQQCMLRAMPELAKWNELHKQFTIAKFRCHSKPEQDA